jgi:hypothetical protein
MRASFAQNLRQQAPAAALAALVAVGVGWAKARPPPRTLNGLARMLGSAVGGTVDPKSIGWEPSPGLLSELLFGRRVLFLAAPRPGAARDVYRAWVRLATDGQPLAVTRVRDLTNTPLGDDTALQVQGNTAVFATVAYGHIQAVTALDLGGIRSDNRPPDRFHRWLLAVNSFQDEGTLAGIGRTDIVLEVPARSAKLQLDLPLVHIDLGERGRGLVYNVDTRALRAARGGQAYAARAIPEVHPPKPLILWGVDTVRAEVGPGPITWLEHKVFGAQDTVRRTMFKLFSSSSESALKKDISKIQASALLDASGMREGAWPPPPIPSLWKEVKPGEGVWKPVTYPWLRPLPGAPPSDKPPPYFYRTFIRPDPKRPYSEVVLIAMDMRQLALGMQAGYEDPKPLTGPPGDGRLPRDEHTLDRVVATFNGAFKTTHGHYGMMVNRRVLLPPIPGAASIVVTDNGDVGLGNWPHTAAIPPDIVSFRQNLDPLVEDGVTNPTGRYIWGWQIEGTSVMTQRTAICVTPARHLYYAWAKAIDGPTLGKALRQAGCSYGIHLDMNPAHSGFVFTRIVDWKDHEYDLAKADPGMVIPADKFVRWSAKDFFYVTVRDALPRPEDGVAWAPDGGAQPPPSWMPGILAGALDVGTMKVSLRVIERGRVDWKIRAGSKEPTDSGSPPGHTALTGTDPHRVLLDVGLGYTTSATRYGLVFGSDALSALRTAYATLVVSPGKPLEIDAPGELPQLGPNDEAVQLPLLADGGQLVDRARSHGAMRWRGALCVMSHGRVLIAQAQNDGSDVVADALLRLGCRRVVELDRGSHAPSFIHRTGTDTPPVKSYDTSVLFALGRPMTPHAFRWKPQGSRPATKPTGYDYPPQPKKN